MRPSRFSSRAASKANGEAIASPVCAISTSDLSGSGDRAGELLQYRPGLLAVLALPLLVEARGLELVTERLWIDLDELHALRGEIGLEGLILLEDVGALVDRGLVEVLRDHVAHVSRQGVPGLAVRQEPETVPHVVGFGEILLHLEQLRKEDDRERILLPLGHLGLQCRIDFREIDRKSTRLNS